MIEKEKLRQYLSKVFSSDIIITGIEKLGEGFHAEGFLIKTKNRKGEKKQYVLKTLREQGFGHDYPSDRANVVIRSLLDYNLLPNHIKAMNVGSIQENDSLLSIGKPKDFFIIMEEAKGTDYWKDMDEIRERGRLSENDKSRIKLIANYLAKIHSEKYTSDNSESLYKRVIRDFVGHGELTMGVLDTFPKKLDFVTNQKLVEIVKKMVEWWEKIKYRHERLSVVHGDFYQGNIWFDNDKLVVLDRSRFRYGEPADDTTCLTTNFITYSVFAYGEFKDPFKELLELFFMEYFKKRNDPELFKVSPLFHAFRALVSIHPLFYNADWSKRHGFDEKRIQSLNDSKRKIINFTKNILDEDEFNIKKINDYLED
jgi:aminoglycoside phosphotransferase (APT) family kinase protein